MGSVCKKSTEGTDQGIHNTKKQMIQEDDDKTAISNENIRLIYQFEKSSVGKKKKKKNYFKLKLSFFFKGKGGFGTVRKLTY